MSATTSTIVVKPPPEEKQTWKLPTSPAAKPLAAFPFDTTLTGFRLDLSDLPTVEETNLYPALRDGQAHISEEFCFCGKIHVKPAVALKLGFKAPAEKEAPKRKKV